MDSTLNAFQIDMANLQLRLSEVVYSRFLLMFFDAAMTASVRPKKGLIYHIQLILSRNVRIFDKVSSLMNLVDTMVPGVSRYLTGLLCNSNWLPFESASVSLIDYGSGATVFLLEREDERKILKVFRKSLGKRLGGLLEVADWYKGRYETVCSWYNGKFDLVPVSIVLIVRGLILGRPVAAALQPYIYGEKKDLFEEFSDDGLMRLMRDDDDLRKQFLYFAEKTVSIFHSEEGLCLDLLGTNNVVLVNNGDGFRLVILDNGIFELEKIKRQSPTQFYQLEERISRLESLLQEATS